MKIEQPQEDEAFKIMSLKLKDFKESEDYIVGSLWLLREQNITEKKFGKKVSQQLAILREFTLDLAHNHGYKGGSEDDWSYSWNFANSLLFTVTIMTTIGYGHISPKTMYGQLFTILYAMIGTPLLLVFLANIGDGMAKALTLTYSRVCCRWCRSSRYKQLRAPGKRAKRVSDDLVGKEEYMPTDEINVPITINLVLITLYLGLGAVIFSEWEQWDIVASYYFTFVTLSTIGFGDYVPGKSFLGRSSGDGGDETFSAASIEMMVTVTYCFVGMALISMCIQIMQDQIVTKVRWAGQEVGIIEDETRPQLRIRRTRRYAVPETAKFVRTAEEKRLASARQHRRHRREGDGAAKRRQSEEWGEEGGQKTDQDLIKEHSEQNVNQRKQQQLNEQQPQQEQQDQRNQKDDRDGRETPDLDRDKPDLDLEFDDMFNLA
ncbi:TWiK family of potassium channels protein 7 [Amphibalanus amphitrite]|uniref:TWiK family of potassium channels protein 7 n=1 Tax=Amphibalanus amphitrite TaxID=1232801 RepID=A0A6A4WH34_AMPAM|nr:TWiK family of potassium channels protein 7 [Amphibalanus amphitrite]